jgi:hypothetical protein
MSLGKKVDVEPLSEQRWSRVERALFDRVAAGEAEPAAPSVRLERAPRWRVGAALVLAGAAASIGGAVTWHVLTGSARQVATAPSRITTDVAGSHVTIGEATLEVAPRSTVAVTGDDAHGVTVLLERGRVECEVPPRNGRPPFSVEAGDVMVRVVGTHFAVSREAGDVDVDVQRGVVEVTAGDRRVDVHAGESWPSSAPVAPSSTPAVPPSATSSAAPVSAPGAGVPAPSPRELYESASRMEASRPDLAVAMYRDLAVRGGPWGMNALFAEGRLELDRGHAAEARRLLGDYLARYPTGPNADDARQLLERLR